MTRDEFTTILNDITNEVAIDFLEKREHLFPQEEEIYISQMQDKLWKLMGREEYT